MPENVFTYRMMTLPRLFLLQEASVGGDFLLQTALDIQQHGVVAALLLNAGTHLSQLCLEHVDLVLET